MTTPFRYSCLALALLVVGMQTAPAQNKKPAITFGSLETLSLESARTQAAVWLKAAGKTDAASQKRFDEIWKQEDRLLIERLADTFALGNADAAKVLSAVRVPVPMVGDVPEIIAKDTGKDQFFRANLAVAYARNLSNRRAFDEALEALKLFEPEQVADPATYLFDRAVCEHALLNKAAANKSIVRLLSDCTDSPERYKNIGLLMFVDMSTWKEKDLGAISRIMENVESELERFKGGPKTQQKQKQIIARLDEIIKKMENDQNPPPGGGDPNDGECPSGVPMPAGGPPTGNNTSSPATQSKLPQLPPASGEAKQARLLRDPEKFIKLEPAEQRRVLQDILREIDPRYRDAVENYYIEILREARQR